MRCASVSRALLTGFLFCSLPTVAWAAESNPGVGAVIPDLDPDGIDRLFIVGKNLALNDPVVVTLGTIALRVLRTRTDLIVVGLPRHIADGTYQLTVRVGSRSTQFVATIDRASVSDGLDSEQEPEGPKDRKRQELG